MVLDLTQPKEAVTKNFIQKMVDNKSIEDDLDLDDEFVEIKPTQKEDKAAKKVEDIEETEDKEEYEKDLKETTPKAGLEEKTEVSAVAETEKLAKIESVKKDEKKEVPVVADKTPKVELVKKDEKKQVPVVTDKTPKVELVKKDEKKEVPVVADKSPKVESVKTDEKKDFPAAEVKKQDAKLDQKEKKEDLVDIPLTEQRAKETTPVKPTRPARPTPPPRPASRPQPTRTVSQDRNNNPLILQLKDAFPSIETKIIQAIAIAAQNNIESCYEACLFHMSPNEFKPTFAPENFVPKNKIQQTEEEIQMKKDEELARNLERQFNSRTIQSRTLSARNSKPKNVSSSRQYIPDDSDDEVDFDAIKENVTKTFRETSNKVGSWFKSFGDNSSDLQKQKEEVRGKNASYEYDEWGHPMMQQTKSYKIVERSPSHENKVLPQRPIDQTPSKQRPNKPFINTPLATEKTLNANQQRSVSGSGNKRLVFVEPVENKPRTSVDDDLNLSD